MDYKMDISEVLLYIKLKKRIKKKINIEELKFMLYSSENYEQVKMFIKELRENKIKIPFKFQVYHLIHFIEDYDDCEEMKKSLLQYKRRKGSVFIHQICLAKTKEQALSIIEESERHGINLDREAWNREYNSIERIKLTQKKWKENQVSGQNKKFTAIYLRYNKLRQEFFNNLSMEQLKESGQNKVGIKNTTVTIFNRCIYVKEFAKRVAIGICQLCENSSPFKDKMGEPFLEVHHVNYLSKGGSDSIENVVALCPNCHRKVHILELEEDYKKLSERALTNISM